MLWAYLILNLPSWTSDGLWQINWELYSILFSASLVNLDKLISLVYNFSHATSSVCGSISIPGFSGSLASSGSFILGCQIINYTYVNINILYALLSINTLSTCSISVPTLSNGLVPQLLINVRICLVVGKTSRWSHLVHHL